MIKLEKLEHERKFYKEVTKAKKYDFSFFILNDGATAIYNFAYEIVKND